MCLDETMVDFEEFVAVAGGVLVRSAGDAQALRPTQWNHKPHSSTTSTASCGEHCLEARSQLLFVGGPTINV